MGLYSGLVAEVGIGVDVGVGVGVGIGVGAGVNAAVDDVGDGDAGVVSGVATVDVVCAGGGL